MAQSSKVWDSTISNFRDFLWDRSKFVLQLNCKVLFHLGSTQKQSCSQILFHGQNTALNQDISLKRSKFSLRKTISHLFSVIMNKHWNMKLLSSYLKELSLAQIYKVIWWIPKELVHCQCGFSFEESSRLLKEDAETAKMQ